MDTCEICLLNHSTQQHNSIKPVKLISMSEIKAMLTPIEKKYINELWHISKGMKQPQETRHDYIKRWFLKRFPEFWSDHQTGLYKIIEQETYWLKT